MMEKLRQIVEGTDTPAAWTFDVTVQTLIILSLISFPIETLPGLPNEVQQGLRWFEVFSVGVFTAEYGLRVLVSRNRLGYIFGFYGIIDLLAILPFYVIAGVDLRGLRAFRLFRLLRLFKLLRYSRAVARFTRALRSIREELILFLIASVLLIYLASIGIYYFEHPVQPETFKSVPHSMWWAVATLTTVGYGDIYPITLGGRLFTTIILFIGLGIIAIPTGLLASALSDAANER
jgi:voltage-gated potassium channel